MTAVYVITPSLPDRSDLLAEAMASVRAQTLLPDGHFVAIDYERAGCAPSLNRALAAVPFLPDPDVWVAVLADDDLLLPHHLATLMNHRHGADVVYPDCRVEGLSYDLRLVRPFDADLLRQGNFIPATALVRLSMLRHVGGFPLADLEDWHLWLRVLDAGGTFRHVPQVTWVYRLGRDNVSHERGLAR